METRTRPRVSKISGTLMHKQVAQSQLRQSHRPWNVENIREESGEVKEASFCLFHFREQTQNLVQENISGESNKGTIIRREGLRPFGETVMDAVVWCVRCVQCYKITLSLYLSCAQTAQWETSICAHCPLSLSDGERGAKECSGDLVMILQLSWQRWINVRCYKLWG